MEINRDLIREAMKEGYSFYQMNGKLVIRRAGGFKKVILKMIPNTVKLPRMHRNSEDVPAWENFCGRLWKMN